MAREPGPCWLHAPLAARSGSESPNVGGPPKWGDVQWALWAATAGWTSACSEVMCTSRNRDKLWWVPECCIHSSTIKYQHLPDEIFNMVKGEVVTRAVAAVASAAEGPRCAGSQALAEISQEKQSGRQQWANSLLPRLVITELLLPPPGGCSSPLQVMSLFRTKRQVSQWPRRLSSVTFLLFVS